VSEISTSRTKKWPQSRVIPGDGFWVSSGCHMMRWPAVLRPSNALTVTKYF